MCFLLNPKFQIPRPKFQRGPTPNAEADGYNCISWDLVFGIWVLVLIYKCGNLLRLNYSNKTFSIFEVL